MKKLKFFLPLLFSVVLSVTTVNAQDEYGEKYLHGKNLYEEGKYTLAMELLKPLTSPADGNKYTEYAHYFYALSAFKSKQYDEARQMLLQLTTRYPNWNKRNEAYYLLANTAFEQGKLHQAMEFAEKAASSKQMRPDLENMKTYYFRKVKSLDTLIDLQRKYDEELSLAVVLVERLSGPFIGEKEYMLREYLMQEFKLDRSIIARPKKVSEKKDVYNVAVLFPFMVKNLDPEKSGRPNQFVLDMYEGMRIAVDSLKEQGVNIKLHAYDTDKDTAKFSALLDKPEMKKMDLIVGPVYSSHNEILAEFAWKNQINVVNPFANSNSLIENNNYVYLFQPSVETQAFKIAGYVGKADTARNNAIILYGESVKDSLLAHAYRDTIERMDYEIAAFRKVKKSSVKDIKELLGDSLLMTKVSHLFVPSSEQIVAATVVSSLDVLRMDIPVIGYAEWLNVQLMSFDQLERRQVHFIMPEYMDYGSKKVKKFKKAYVKKMDIYPSSYAFQGYELMSAFGNYLGKYGNMFNEDLQKCGRTDGKVMGAVDFSCSNSNQVVPLIKFQNSFLGPVTSVKKPLPSPEVSEDKKTKRKR
ncbi:ABC transporter substrate-binding protein [Cytophagaceae bacterium ABcell3]|nr:ABC transporter substrate-binding protein [Cytophagaceae bacterium ABcell3]